MIRNTFIGIVLLFFLACTDDIYIFDRVHNLVSNEKYLESIAVLDSIKSENKKNESIEFEADCLKGTVYYHLQEFDKAKKFLKKGLQFDKIQNPVNNLISYQGDFESTKYLAGKILIDIYIKEKNYTEALHILNLINGKYGSAICGTYYLESENYINNKFAECYLQLDSFELATSYIKGNLFSISDFFTPEVYPIFLGKLKAKYSNQQLDSLAKSAISNLSVENKIDYEENIISCYTNFLNLKIEISNEYNWTSLNSEFGETEIDTLTGELTSQLMINASKKYIENSKLYNDLTKKERSRNQ